jgi:predicted ATPase
MAAVWHRRQGRKAKLKIEHVTLRNFKRFENLTIEIKNKALDEVADQFLILGDNGTGKTTVLQAIALCLSLASGRTKSIESFDWLGWIPGRYGRWGQPHIGLTVHFTEDEIDATAEAARRWWESRSKDRRKGPFQQPGRAKTVHLRLDGEQFENDLAELYQFMGRFYAASILYTDPSARDLFDRLPGVFWFDQFRNLATPQGVRELERTQNTEDQLTIQVSFEVGVARLREYLNRWKLERIRTGAPGHRRHDYLLELENLYKRVFPGRSFTDPEPMFRGGIPSPADYYFMISDGHRTYDIEEMSAGEQAVFPMLYEFVRQQIKNSIVLIDEIDLNLHPPLAQTLLNVLPQLGANCQFIYTTHSDAISSVVSPEQVCRLPGGHLCL